MARARARERSKVETFAAWAEPAPKRPSIDRERLVRAALALLDAAGFDALTMRRLAERLGVQAASLYNHVRDKHELLALLADAICAHHMLLTGGEANLPSIQKRAQPEPEAPVHIGVQQAVGEGGNVRVPVRRQCLEPPFEVLADLVGRHIR